MKSYLVPHGYGEAEFVEKRSRFIGRVWPVEDEAEAIARVKEMREKHWDATHNVYAYIMLEGGIMRYSDDGEPGGTSGMPTLNVFRAEDIKNVCCVVTRYFGGVLLGAGGLVRAYSNTAKLALDAAGISRMDSWDELLISCAYNQFERVRRLLEDNGAVIQNTDFGTDVLLETLLSQEKSPAFRDALTELTAGTATCDCVGSTFRGVRVR
ncbi:MAG: YigZ family protein [Candidatus Heteroscillospira sp.]